MVYLFFQGSKSIYLKKVLTSLIWSVVKQPTCQNRLPDKPVDHWSIFSRQLVFADQHVRIFQMSNCPLNDGKHNKLSANGHFKINSCSTEYSTTLVSDKIGNRRRNNLIWPEGHRMCRPTKKKGFLEMWPKLNWRLVGCQILCYK